MRLNKQWRRLIGWMSACTILLAALAPALSHALLSGSDGSSSWQVLCSASSNNVSNTNSADPKASSSSPASPAQQDGDHWFKHCPFCATHADALALLPSELPLYALTATGNAQPMLFTQARRTLFAWATPRSRAPPAIS